ncbi:MAG: sugar nucleotide-binding protein [Planctomycetota bacterium]|jgi:dTDP-4-dehydrorhamnose reductase|nr:sugar nucleotide-binding protein [Planctomycetota bacterium]
MKLLILGAGGLAGHAAALHFQERGHRVIGAARRELTFCPTVRLDARRREEVAAAVGAEEYDAVINCVGILNRAVDANPHEGIYLNACLPHLLAELTRDRKTRVIHLSTDCVFSGRRSGGGYREGDFCDADSLYGRSKALGELRDEKNLTFRTSIVGPDPNPEGVGLFNWFMRQEGAVSGYATVVWNGVTNLVLARALEAALEQGLGGLYHLAGPAPIGKYELLRLFNGLRGKSAEIIESTAVRTDKSLADGRGDFDFTMPTYAEMVNELGGWISAHEHLYPHYALKDAGEVFESGNSRKGSP